MRFPRIITPLAPINGVLAVSPVDFLPTRTGATGAVAAALGEDLATISLAFGLRFPVVVAGSGLEKESAFPDLLQRIGKEGCLKTIGQVFPINQPATSEQMQTLRIRMILATRQFESSRASRASVQSRSP